MMKNLALKVLFTVWLVAGSGAAAASDIQIVMDQGKRVAQFSLADSICMLVDDQVRCVPKVK